MKVHTWVRVQLGLNRFLKYNFKWNRTLKVTILTVCKQMKTFRHQWQICQCIGERTNSTPNFNKWHAALFHTRHKHYNNHLLWIEVSYLNSNFNTSTNLMWQACAEQFLIFFYNNLEMLWNHWCVWRMLISKVHAKKSFNWILHFFHYITSENKTYKLQWCLLRIMGIYWNDKNALRFDSISNKKSCEMILDSLGVLFSRSFMAGCGMVEWYRCMVYHLQRHITNTHFMLEVTLS